MGVVVRYVPGKGILLDRDVTGCLPGDVVECWFHPDHPVWWTEVVRVEGRY